MDYQNETTVSVPQPGAGQKVWLEPLAGGTTYGPFADELTASDMMDTLGLTDDTHKLVWR